MLNHTVSASWTRKFNYNSMHVLTLTATPLTNAEGWRELHALAPVDKADVIRSIHVLEEKNKCVIHISTYQKWPTLLKHRHCLHTIDAGYTDMLYNVQGGIVFCKIMTSLISTEKMVSFNDGLLFLQFTVYYWHRALPGSAEGQVQNISGASQKPNADAVQNHAFAALEHGGDRCLGWTLWMNLPKLLVTVSSGAGRSPTKNRRETM